MLSRSFVCVCFYVGMTVHWNPNRSTPDYQVNSCKWMVMHVIWVHDEKKEEEEKTQELELISLSVFSPVSVGYKPCVEQPFIHSSKGNAMHFSRVFNKLCIIYIGKFSLFAFIILNWGAMKMHIATWMLYCRFGRKIRCRKLCWRAFRRSNTEIKNCWAFVIKSG